MGKSIERLRKVKKYTSNFFFGVEMEVPIICGTQDSFLGGALGSETKLVSAEEVGGPLTCCGRFSQVVLMG